MKTALPWGSEPARDGGIASNCGKPWSDFSFAVVIRSHADIDQILRRLRIALIAASVAFDVEGKTVLMGNQQHHDNNLIE
jgi:hypothetical protein